MEAEQWKRIRTIFGDAVELEGQERAAYLDRACPEDPGLRSHVERLLASLSEAGDFLESPFESPGPESPQSGVDPYEGLEIGPYRLQKRIGRGGMGVVYLATRADKAFRKRVAIKLLEPGVDTDEIVRRFRDERQILAGLDHPNIAKLIDGGTTPQGLPYLVMDYIEGISIDEYCDRHDLDVRGRLELFRRVCSAVQFAHQNLVVHRDIKPSNILVAEDGIPKLLDFGIAKLLNPELSAQRLQPTATALRIMTPEYASPEQIRGDPVNTASDVYSLGVLLYRLLSGHSPYRVKSGSPAQLVQAICKDEPAKLSDVVSGPRESGEFIDASSRAREIPRRSGHGDSRKLRRRLSGDLDNIVLMALRKEPRRRYGSVEQLAEDIRRHLEGRPVQACENTFVYRLSKLVARNRWKVMMTAALVTSALVFSIGITLQHAQITRERDRAELVTEFLVDLFEVSDPFAESKLGGTITARELLNRGAAKLVGGLQEQPKIEATLQGTVGRIYERLGLLEDSGPFLESALKTRRELFGDRHPKVAESMYDLAVLRASEGSYDAASSLLESALEIQGEKLGRRNRRVGDTLAVLGAVQMEQGNYEVAEPVLAEALRLRRDVLGEHPAVAKSLNDLALLYQKTGDYGEARTLLEESLGLRQRLLSPTHPDVAGSKNDLANLALAQGDYQTAEVLFRESFEIYRSALGEKHPYVGRVLINRATVLAQIGKLDEAKPLYREAITLNRELLGPDHPTVAMALHNYGSLLFLDGELDEAERLLRESLEIRRESVGDEHADVAETLDHLGLVLHAKTERAEAEDLLLRALSIRRRLLDENHPRIAVSERHLASFYAESGDYARCETHAHDALAILQGKLPPDDWQVKSVESILGGCLAGLGRHGEAEPLLLASYEVLREKLGNTARPTRQALERLIRFYESSDRTDKAEELRAQMP